MVTYTYGIGSNGKTWRQEQGYAHVKPGLSYPFREISFFCFVSIFVKSFSEDKHSFDNLSLYVYVLSLYGYHSVFVCFSVVC